MAMAPKTHKTFDFEQLTFGSQTTSTRSGGKCVRVGYGPTYSQVEFQLGTMPENTLVCAWGAELANKEDPTSGKIMKLELDEASHAFLTRFDQATVAAANQYSQSWFNRPTPTHSHNSSIKQQNGTLPNGNPRPDVVKIKIKEEGPRATKISVCRLHGDKGTADWVPGTMADIVKGSRVLVRCRVQGGVYFVSRMYGCSLEAVSLRVVLNDDTTQNGGDDFDMGDCIMVDTDDVDSLS